MATAVLRTQSGSETGSVDLDDSIFGITPNMATLHQVVTAQLAARRSGSHNTKTRAERRGGGAKPWRQKGTGRARQGSIRSPQFVGGGVAHGPKPRDYSQKTPKKMKRLALRSALSDRAAENRIVVVEGWDFPSPKTKDAQAALDSLDLSGKIMLVLGASEVTAWKSFRNIPEVHLVESGELNAYDVLVADWVIFTSETLPEAGPGESGHGADTVSEPEAAVEAEAVPEPEPDAAPAEPEVEAATSQDPPVVEESVEGQSGDEESGEQA